MPPCCSHAAGIPPAQLALLLGAGFTMSLGHCLGMCGPLVGAFAVRQRALGAGPRALAFANAVYHAGRIAAYTSIGVVLGFFGSVITREDGVLQGWFALLAGVFMLLLGLGLLGLVPVQRWVERIGPGRQVARSMGALLGAADPGRRFLLGFANGFLPCGPVAAVGLSAAATGSAWRGGLAMLAFGAGTVPVLVAFGLSAGTLAASVRARLFRIGAILVVLIAAQLGLRGLHALGLVGGLKIGPVVFW